MILQELQTAVSSLPTAELTQFSEWFAEFMADQWDRQIEQDVASGRLAAALKRADEHYEAGRGKPL